MISITHSETIDPEEKHAITIYATGLILATFWLYWPMGRWLFVTWRYLYQDTFGYLVPVVSGWILHAKWKDIRTITPDYAPLGWFFFIPGIGLAYISRLSDNAALACLSLPFYLYGICLLIWGKTRSRYLLFPIFFCLFLYPWDTLIESTVGFQLRLLSTRMAFGGLNTLDLDAAVSGTLLYTGQFLIDVSPACSGLTILKVLFFFGAIAAYAYPGHLRYKLLLWGSIVPLSVVLNSFRIVSIGLIGHFISPDKAIAFFHHISGFLFFGVAMLILYGEAVFYKKVEGI